MLYEVITSSEQARLLQVSSVPLATAKPAVQKVVQPAKPARSFRSAVVFVIDSTLSMDPYIDRTREAVRKIYDTITQEQLTGDVSFGLIARITSYNVCYTKLLRPWSGYC